MNPLLFADMARRLDEIGLSEKEIVAMPNALLADILHGKGMLVIVRGTCRKCGERQFTAVLAPRVKDLRKLFP